jgi:probable HAF family extracellular repeat protein
MRIRTPFRTTRFSVSPVNARFLIPAMICLVAYFVSTNPMAAQQFRSTPLVHPDGSFSPRVLNSLAQIAGTVTINDTTYHAVRREPYGQYTNLQEFGGNLSQAFCINDKGDVAGITIDENGYGHTVVWENGDVRELSVPLNAAIAPIPVDLNDSGLVTGYYWDAGGINYALVWDTSGAFQFLSMGAGVQNYPSAMNDAGAVVGAVRLADGTTRAYLWQPDTSLKSGLADQALVYTARDIGTLGGYNAQAADINNRGQVVGFSSYDTSSLFVHAFLWQDSIMVDLGTLGGDNSIATAINNEGIVMGRSQLADSAVTKSGIPDPLRWAGGIDFDALKDGQFGSPVPFMSTTADLQDHEDDAFYIRASRWFSSYAMSNPEDPEHGGLGTDLDDAWSINSDKGFLGWDFETGYTFIRSNLIFLDPNATGGSAGFHWDPYNLYNHAVADDTEVAPSKFFFKAGVYSGNNDIMTGKNFFGTYAGMGYKFQYYPPNTTVVLDGDLNVQPGASVTFKGGMDNTFIICQQSNINGDVMSRNGTNIFFREGVTTGIDARMIFGGSKVNPSLIQFDSWVMGEGSMSFKKHGGQQLNIYGDVRIPITVDKKDNGQLVINPNNYSFSDFYLKRGDVVPLYGFSMNENAELQLGRGWFRSLFGGPFVFNNPDPDGITGASDSAYIRMPIQRNFGRAGSYLFPTGVFGQYSPISIKTDYDVGAKLSLTIEYRYKDDLDEAPEIPDDFNVFVPKLGRNVHLDVLYDHWYKLTKDGEFTQDPDVCMELNGIQNMKTLLCAHPVQVDLQTRILELAGKDPGQVESSLLEGVPKVCQPEVEIKDSMLMGIATNRFLNAIDQSPTQVFVRTRFINLTYDLTQIDTYVDNANIHFSVGFKQGTPFGMISEGYRTVEAVDAGEQDNSNPVIEEDIDFTAGKNYTIVAAGMGTDQTFFVDPGARLKAADDDKIEFKFFNGHPDFGPLIITPVINGNSASYDLQIDYGEFSETKSEVPALVEIPILTTVVQYDLTEKAGESLIFLLAPRIVNDDSGLKSSSEEAFDLVLLDALGREIVPVAVTSVDESLEEPTEYSLQANYPNPFAGSTHISYSIPEAMAVRLTITNMAGQQVRRLVDTWQQPGYHTIEWDSRDDSGKAMPAGIYLYRLETGDFSQTRTMMRIR